MTDFSPELIKILTEIKLLQKTKFTGRITFDIDMRNGGVGTITKTLREVVKK